MAEGAIEAVMVDHLAAFQSGGQLVRVFRMDSEFKLRMWQRRQAGRI